MADIRIVTGTSSPVRTTGDNQFLAVQGTRDGALYTADWFMARAMEGRLFAANSGTASTPVTFAGAYDPDAPDMHIHVPSGTLIIPAYIMVKYEAVGTESELEVIGLASATGGDSATGTSLTIRNMRMDAPVSSNCTAVGSVDAGGVTDPNSGNAVEFWRRGHPLKDTSATGENDRHEQVYEWTALNVPSVPIIPGAGSLSVYAASQAGTGFITVIWAEVPSSSIV